MSDRIQFSDQESYELTRLDEEPRRSARRRDVRDEEEECQRSMKVRGRRLVMYHLRKGDLPEYLESIGLKLSDVRLLLPAAA